MGTWLVLKRRNLAQFSWLVFAGVAIIGSVGAAMLVQSARGIRADVKQQSVIDLDGPSGLAHVRTVYGLKMPYDARVDVGFTTVGRDDLSAEELADSYIRPSSDLEASSGTAFAVRRDYTIPYGRHGTVGRAGAGDGQAVRVVLARPDPRDGAGVADGVQAGQLAGGSWITNGTDLDLRDCYLVYATTNSLNVKARDGMINVVRIGRLPAGKTRNDLADLTNGQAGKSDPLDAVSTQVWWKNLPIEMPGRRGNQEYAPPAALTDSASRVLAATMISVLSDCRARTGGHVRPGQRQDSTPSASCRGRGPTGWTCGTFWTAAARCWSGWPVRPGPMRLKVNGGAVQPSAGECIVRIVVPLAR